MLANKDVYSMNNILRTAHRFSDLYFIDVQATDGTDVRILLKAKSAAGEEPSSLEGRFLNELLDGKLREIIAEESRLERDVILAHALSRHPVLLKEYEAAEAFTDPVGLLTPDET
ncbi:hypothetical protein BGE01nite_23810 [Brevifollis gellanilyticus]|uniref:His-Xaa-Ser system protein HxsD n=1 Tax=Brevifollis gellanilyticus TaxID=748831 RepID=A0A512M8L5_9BACT|nr:hypothetical protein BGE01nite_23810 [Brevifollis gellanilyticus]